MENRPSSLISHSVAPTSLAARTKAPTNSILIDPAVVATNEIRAKAFVSRALSPKSGNRSPTKRTLGHALIAANKAARGQGGRRMSMDGFSELSKEAFADERFPLLMKSKQPEFDQRLGERSRFGDGDGSFWDRWLVGSSVGIQKPGDGGYTALRLPERGTAASGSVQPRSGFKRFQADKLLTPPRIPPYAARHLYKATYYKPKGDMTKDLRHQIDDMIRGVDPDDMSAFEYNTDPDTDSSRPSTANKMVFVPVPVGLPTDGEIGTQSLDTQRFRNVSMPVLGSATVAVGMDTLHAAGIGMARPSKQEIFMSSTMAMTLPTLHMNRVEEMQMRKKYSGELAKMEFQRYYKRVQKERQHFTKDQMSRLRPYSIDGAHAIDTVLGRPASRPASPTSGGEPEIENDEEQEEQEEAKRERPLCGRDPTQTTPEEMLDASLSQVIEMMTSRGRFLHGCVDHDLMPRANLLLRKKLTDSIDVSHAGMGDELMLVLARAISELPGITHLDISDNALTDASLHTVARALCKMKSLTSLHVSENKIDSRTAATLADFLTYHARHLRRLSISRADIDDLECNHFVSAITKYTKVHWLDMSHNLIGAMEVYNVLHTGFQTGGTSVAEALREPKCLINYLDLSWNYLRLVSARDLGRALAVNESLTELNLEYNGFGTEGAEQLGMSLFFNQNLKSLNLSHNNVGARAAFVLAVACKCNKTLRHLDLSGNPLGVRGGKEVLSIATWLKEPLDLKLKGCNFQVHDEMCWFDVENPIGTYNVHLSDPYDRAVLQSLLLRYERDDSINIENVVHQHEGSSTTYQLARSPRSTADGVRWDIGRAEVVEKFIKWSEGERALGRGQVEAALRELDILPTSEVERETVLQSYIRKGDNGIGLESFVHLYDCMRQAQAELRHDGHIVLNAATKQPWSLPLQGTISFTVVVRRVIAKVSPCSTKQQVENLLRLASSVENTDQLISLSLPRLRLHVDEALMLYEKIFKDKGDRVAALEDMLPFLAGPFECRVLVADILARRENDKRRLRDHLGPLFGPLMGLCSGRYCLDLSKPSHRLTVERILAVSNTHKIERMRRGLGDTSQRGDWSCVRNARLNSVPVLLSDKTWDVVIRKLPTGALDFDFILSLPPPDSLQPECNEDLLDFCVRVGIVYNSGFSVRRANNDLVMDTVKKPASMATGKRLAWALAAQYHDPLPDPDLRAKLEAAGSLYEQDDYDYELWVRNQARQEGKDWDGTRTSASSPVSTKDSGSAADGSATKQRPSSSTNRKDGKSTSAAAAARTDSPIPPVSARKTILNASAASLTPPSSSRKTVVVPERGQGPPGGISPRLSTVAHPPVRMQLRSGKQKVTRAPGAFCAVVKTYIAVIRAAQLLVHKARLKLNAERILYDLQIYVATRVFTAKQARLLIDRCPRCSKYQSVGQDLRVDVTVMLYPRIVDRQNFDQVLTLFEPELEAAVICRLGYLNTFSPLRPDGYVELDCTRREEAQIVRVLMHLAKVEPGKCWLKETYRFNRFTQVMPGWDLSSASWYEKGVPSKGQVSLRFFSGGDLGLLGRCPDPVMRTAMCVLTGIDVSRRMREAYPQLVGKDLMKLLKDDLTSKQIGFPYDEEISNERISSASSAKARSRV